MSQEAIASRTIRMRYTHTNLSTGIGKDTYWTGVERTALRLKTVRRRRPALLDFTEYSRAGELCLPAVGTYVNKINGFARMGTLIDATSVQPFKTANLVVDHGYYGLIPVTNLRARSRAENKALTMLKASKISLGLAAAEGRETLGFVASKTRSVLSAVRHLVNGDKDGFARTVNRASKKRFRNKPAPRVLRITASQWSKSASKRWMEYNWALVPLLDDIHGAQEALTAMAEEVLAPATAFVYAAATEAVSVDQSFVLSIVQDGYTGVAKIRGKQRYSVGYMYQVNDREIQRLASLGLTNPASVFWSATAKSFVIDWGINIAQFLDNWDAAIGLTCIDGFSVSYLDADAILGSRKVSSDRRLALSLDREGLKTYRGFVRRKTAYFPYPSLYTRNPFSGYTIAATAAMVRQMMN